MSVQLLSRETFRKASRKLKRAIPMIGPVVFFVSIVVLYRQLRGLDFQLVFHTMGTMSAPALFFAAGLTVLAYINLTFVELLSNVRVSSNLGYKRIGLVSFVAYCFSKNIGFSVISGGAVRLRLYREWGQDFGNITKIIILNYISFWLGLFFVTGMAFAVSPPTFVRELDLLTGTFRVFGVLLLLLIGGYFLLIKKIKRPLKIGTVPLQLPNARFTMWQIVVSSADWLITAGVLYAVFSGHNVMSFYETLGIFLVAQFAGLTSQVPGGMGVFEALFVVILSERIEKAYLVAVLLTYRILFFFIPFAVAAAAFGIIEYRHNKHLKEILSRAKDRNQKADLQTEGNDKNSK